MAKITKLSLIVLMTAAATESGEYRDAGSELVVPDDISEERAHALIASGGAMEPASYDAAIAGSAGADAGAGDAVTDVSAGGSATAGADAQGQG